MGRPLYWRLAGRAPWAMAALYGRAPRDRPSQPEAREAMLLRGGSEPEQAVLKRPEVAARLTSVLRRHVRARLDRRRLRGGDRRLPAHRCPGEGHFFIHDRTGEVIEAVRAASAT